MSRYILSTGLLAMLGASCLAGTDSGTQWENARNRMSSLRFGSYATSQQVEQLATDEAFRARAWEAIQKMGITKLYVEVYRGGHTVSSDQLVFVRDWLKQKGLDVVGGIATVPGGEIGVRQKGPLGWFNWQNTKTQRDLERIMRTAAPLFDTFIVDDFLCTGDVGEESKLAKGDRSWAEYRRALMTQVAQSVFVGPAKQVNPGITMIVKYPQWYDRFHLFGYDTETLPRLFDRVWVGTETRGRNTRRFGFVQPYEGFVNYRWLAGIAGDKIGGAWFDHGDCAEHDFLDQAYMSVLAGARELVFFNLGDVVSGHSDHAKVVAEFDRLADLAAFVRTHPVAGVPAYKPPNSDPGGDMYLMDLLGMLGIPLVPVHRFPESAPVIFLPAQAAADPDLPEHIRRAMAKGTHVIVTTSLLIALPHAAELVRMVGVDPNLRSSPTRATCTTAAGEVTLDLETPLETAARSGDVVCTAGGKTLLLLRTVSTPSGTYLAAQYAHLQSGGLRRRRRGTAVSPAAGPAFPGGAAAGRPSRGLSWGDWPGFRRSKRRDVSSVLRHGRRRLRGPELQHASCKCYCGHAKPDHSRPTTGLDSGGASRNVLPMIVHACGNKGNLQWHIP